MLKETEKILDELSYRLFKLEQMINDLQDNDDLQSEIWKVQDELMKLEKTLE
jgi:hypothetical protein